MIDKPRVTGGIILGWKGKRPMAVANEPETEIVTADPTITYRAKPQICGFPWRTASSGVYSVGPITGPQTGILAPEITTGLDVTGTGVRIYLREIYRESVVYNGAIWVWGGAVTGGATAEIIVRDYSDETDENVLPILDISTGSAPAAVIMWQVAIVRKVDGEYYICTSLIPPDNGAPYDRVFPDEFDIVNPL